MIAATAQPTGQDASPAGLAALAGLIYLVALLLGAVPGPLSLARMAWGHVRTREGTTPRSEAMSPHEASPPPVDVCPDPMSRPASPRPAPEIEAYGADGAVLVSREHTNRWGPLPELAHLAGRDEPASDPPPAATPPAAEAGPPSDDPDPAPRLRRGAGAADRHRWIRWQQQAGRRPAWIDREGARLAGCTEKTIQRDRQHIKAAQEARP